MEGKSIPQYLNISQTVQISNQRISTYTFSNKEEKANPENEFFAPLDSSKKLHSSLEQGAQDIMNSRENSVQRHNRSKDKSKTHENYQNHKQSNSMTFMPKGLQLKTNLVENKSGQQESESTYRNLTDKLESALKKISISGKPLNKSSSQSNDIWRRSQLMVQRKKKQIQKKRQQSQAEKLKQFREKPLINKYSEKIVKEIGHEPIHVRFQKIVERKKKKIEETEESKKKQKEDEQNLYLQELNRYMKKPSNMRTYDQYFNEMVRWKEKAEERNKQKLQEQKKKQVQGATFKPLLNNKSKKMAAEQNRLPIDQRGLIKAKSSLDFSFTPKINRKACK